MTQLGAQFRPRKTLHTKCGRAEVVVVTHPRAARLLDAAAEVGRTLIRAWLARDSWERASEAEAATTQRGDSEACARRCQGEGATETRATSERPELPTPETSENHVDCCTTRRTCAGEVTVNVCV